ncbi:MAG TPA: DinB family protein [Bryobacteraceae bacterium]
MLETIRLLYEYNRWAMDRIFQTLEQLTEAEYGAPGCSGHGSIRDTLAHLINAQRGWFWWFDGTVKLDGSSSMEQLMAMRLTGADVPSIARAKEHWQTVDRLTQNVLTPLTQDMLAKVWTASIPGSPTISLPLGELLLHVANHGTHTRAQIVSAIRRFDRKPGNLDLLFFALTRQSQGKPAAG